MTLDLLVTYAFVAAVSIASPRPATVLAMNNSLSYGLKTVVWSSLGNVTGLFFVSTLSSLGLGALLSTSAELFLAMKILGAAYLFYLGYKQLFGAANDMPNTAVQASPSPSRQQLFSTAFTLAMTNPKAILFFAALFPQFIEHQAPLLPQFLTLTAIFMALSFTSLMGYAALASRAKGFLANAQVWRNYKRIVGLIYITFGAGLLVLTGTTKKAV